ncbi:MAG: hypothetical protein KF799_08960 [Bdellovibrionales bacterium]|nr:hypothetical protein [Bdellovibrionales bacterium]
MRTDAALHPLLIQASEHFRQKNLGEVAQFLEMLSKVAKLRRLSREEVENISIIFAPRGQWESTLGHPELSTTLARILNDI